MQLPPCMHYFALYTYIYNSLMVALGYCINYREDIETDLILIKSVSMQLAWVYTDIVKLTMRMQPLNYKSLLTEGSKLGYQYTIITDYISVRHAIIYLL